MLLAIISVWGPAGCQTSRIVPIMIESKSAAVNVTEPNEVMWAYEEVLKEYIGKNGRIEYKKLAEDEEALTKLDSCYLAWVGQAEAQELDQPPAYQDGRQAFYINAYNACVLRGVLEIYRGGELSHVPENFYEDLHFLVASERLCLDQIALQCGRDIDWRVSFALGGPCRSEPAIAKTLYTPENLHRQLDEAVKNYLGSCAGMRIDHARKQILFGKLIYDREEFFIKSYYDRYNIKGVSLITALAPWSAPRTQGLLADLVGYGVARQKWDFRLNDVVEDEESIKIDELPCGIR